ncbi:SIMPL domain-containing protein [Agromyces mediolanus]|uniref:SIMPL domain-containing protein n=1 Tax=Agromyces mediolanus TaxID=41986 RepID=UPI003839534E
MGTLITVTATAEERVEPELGAVQLSVGASGAERQQVVDRTAAAHERLLGEVRRLDADGVLEQWSAGQLRVWSHRPFNAEGRQLPAVHEARGELELVFRDLAALSAWVSEQTSGEELTLGGVDWRLTEETAARVRETAQRRAVGEAVAKAAVYASALGLGTPTPVELADSGLLDARPAPMAKGNLARAVAFSMDAQQAPVAEFVPADLVVSATVEARFDAPPAA